MTKRPNSAYKNHVKRITGARTSQRPASSRPRPKPPASPPPPARPASAPASMGKPQSPGGKNAKTTNAKPVVPAATPKPTTPPVLALPAPAPKGNPSPVVRRQYEPLIRLLTSNKQGERNRARKHLQRLVNAGPIGPNNKAWQEAKAALEKSGPVPAPPVKKPPVHAPPEKKNMPMAVRGSNLGTAARIRNALSGATMGASNAQSEAQLRQASGQKPANVKAKQAAVTAEGEKLNIKQAAATANGRKPTNVKPSVKPFSNATGRRDEVKEILKGKHCRTGKLSRGKGWTCKPSSGKGILQRLVPWLVTPAKPYKDKGQAVQALRTKVAGPGYFVYHQNPKKGAVCFVSSRGTILVKEPIENPGQSLETYISKLGHTIGTNGSRCLYTDD